MKKIILLTFFCLPALVIAEPSSLVAWTPEQLQLVKNGNPQNGRKLAETCIGCHGEKGISAIPNYPSLAGQTANYTFKQLRDYADNKRVNPLMSSIAQGLSEQDMADLAAWFSSLPPSRQKSSEQTFKKAEHLVFQGDSKRILTPCFLCHGAKGQGEEMDIPALAGQQAEYFAETLKAYKSGQRHNDIYSRMRLISRQLSAQEIEQLGKYYQNLED